MKKPNLLIHETSPYLLQHAYNPVQWHPWSEEVFRLSKEQDKPVLISIGYSSCHWCHVMERESFENDDIAALMNEYFINVKIDREERPDLDAIYMEAVQAISGSGGWPMNVFLTPDKKPFYGGTYFPPAPMYNRLSWPQVLMNIHHAWINKKDDIEEQAKSLTEHISKENIFVSKDANGFNFDQAYLKTITTHILAQADMQNGGFGTAPKFPQTYCIRFLLASNFLQENESAKNAALTALDKMLQGGIYDHAAGGFSRYATDTEWLIPHFEKMLYDNALLLSALAEAYQVTKAPHYSIAIRETFNFLQREMKSADGVFYSAIDADSEGEEGLFYLWTKEEFTHVANDSDGVLATYFGVSENGNFEGKNILNTPVSFENFCAENHLDKHAFRHRIATTKNLLVQARSNRQRPLTDDKILLGWNALLLTSFCKIYGATGEVDYRAAALQLYEDISLHLKTQDGMKHQSKASAANENTAFADDLAYWIEALLELHKVTANEKFLYEAKEYTSFTEKHFSDGQNVYFFFTQSKSKDVLFRKTELYDGATPSANSIMCKNLNYLGWLFDNNRWKDRSLKMLNGVAGSVTKYTTSFSSWALASLFLVAGANQIIYSAANLENEILIANKVFFPPVLLIPVGPETTVPLMIGKHLGDTNYYLCREFTCFAPVNSAAEICNHIKTFIT